jgi:hypothetical protein
LFTVKLPVVLVVVASALIITSSIAMEIGEEAAKPEPLRVTWAPPVNVLGLVVIPVPIATVVEDPLANTSIAEIT